MPTIVGTALADASGTALQDASAVALGEPDLLVGISTGGVLMEAVWMTVAPWVAELAATIALELASVILGPTGPTTEGLDEDIQLIRHNLETGEWGGYTIRESLEQLRHADHYSLQTIRDDIAALEAGGLTTEEHDQLMGIDPPDPGTIGQAVWNHEIPITMVDGVEADQPASLYLRDTATAAYNTGVADGWELPTTRWWRLWCVPNRQGTFEWALDVHPSQYYVPPDPDFTHVEVGDTLLTFLQREYPTITWVTIPTPRGNEARRYGYVCTGQGFTVYVGPAFTLPELQASHADMVVGEGLIVDVPVPPIWPGLAGATLGEPIALAAQMTVLGAMDGVLVDVTGTDANTLFYTYGGVKAYRHIGGIAFMTDDGQLEQWQALGFESAIYTPRTMKQAGGVRLFTGRGAAGTLTPWTVTTP